jgi:cephalosporin hydroxylase
MRKKITTQEVELLGSDSQLVFGGTFEGGINLQQVPDEIVNCINEIISSKKDIKNFLEIGSAAGGTSFLFDYVFDLENIVIIDDNQHPKHGLRPENLKKAKGKVNEFIGNSQTPDAIDFIKNLKMKFDVILIDGDHSYAGVTLDIKNYEPFLNKGGFLILHDIEIVPSVKTVFEELEKDYSWITKKYISEIRRPCGLGLLKRS